MKSDERLQSEIQAEINADPKISEPGRIGVAVKHGVVTLTGQVQEESCKREAERAAWRVEGIRAVAEEIEIQPAESAPTDAEVADAVATLLEWSADLDAKDIHARVENGWVTLEGSVPRPAERRAATRLTSQVRGAKGVSNRIRIAKLEAQPIPIEALGPEDSAGWTPIDDEC